MCLSLEATPILRETESEWNNFTFKNIIIPIYSTYLFFKSKIFQFILISNNNRFGNEYVNFNLQKRFSYNT